MTTSAAMDLARWTAHTTPDTKAPVVYAIDASSGGAAGASAGIDDVTVLALDLHMEVDPVNHME